MEKKILIGDRNQEVVELIYREPSNEVKQKTVKSKRNKIFNKK